MRFQSTTSYSKLAPTITADGYGPSVGVGLTNVPSAGTQTLVPAPPAGQMTRIFSLAGQGNTTAASTTLARIQGANSGIMIAGAYAAAGGALFFWSGNMPVSEALMAVNAWGVPANFHAYYRYELIPL